MVSFCSLNWHSYYEWIENNFIYLRVIFVYLLWIVFFIPLIFYQVFGLFSPWFLRVLHILRILIFICDMCCNSFPPSLSFVFGFMSLDLQKCFYISIVVFTNFLLHLYLYLQLEIFPFIQVTQEFTYAFL